MTDKKVTEQEFKIFTTYEDAKDDKNYVIKNLEYEGPIPQQCVKINQDDYMLIGFTRHNGLDKVLEKVYVKM